MKLSIMNFSICAANVFLAITVGDGWNWAVAFLCFLCGLIVLPK